MFEADGKVPFTHHFPINAYIHFSPGCCTDDYKCDSELLYLRIWWETCPLLELCGFPFVFVCSQGVAKPDAKSDGQKIVGSQIVNEMKFKSWVRPNVPLSVFFPLLFSFVPHYIFQLFICSKLLLESLLWPLVYICFRVLYHCKPATAIILYMLYCIGCFLV